MLYFVIACVFVYMCIAMAVSIQYIMAAKNKFPVDAWFRGLFWPFTIFFSFFSKKPL